jgi:hypothetical protein
MKLSLLFAVFVASAAAETEGGVRKRDLASAGGSVSVKCFSEVASVDVLGKGSVQMKNLEVGDRIFTGESYQSVYAFGHRETDTKAHFLQVETDKGSSLEITGNHLMFVDGKSSAVRAESIKVGDSLGGNKVTKVGVVERTGLYAPFTTDGKLIVDGVKVSSYAPPEEADGHFLFGGRLQEFSHFGVSPFRLLCTGFSSGLCHDYNEEGMPSVLAFLKGASDWFLAQPFYTQIVAIAAYLVVSSVSWVLECIMLTPAALPALAALIAGLMVASKAHTKKVVV